MGTATPLEIKTVTIQYKYVYGHHTFDGYLSYPRGLFIEDKWMIGGTRAQWVDKTRFMKVGNR
ncbi:MAG: hypothetical protein IIA89_03105 [Chloroflexi bacterium]|nr:hypothetical protein [Chloroflexota bacterium]MCH8875793.1 hypothetical protein [Chloroflexota bacterium]MCI0806944.1 hypothetical protein [Chloroflexota bacterium]